MRQVRARLWFGLVFAALILTACDAPAGENGGQAGSIPDLVVCEVFYRPAAGASFDDEVLTLSTAGDQGTLAFDDMAFGATFLSDAGEGQSLSIVVTDSASGNELARGLYQFDPQAGLRDQFIGGHGFTGLTYVYHPASDSEVQYFCGGGE
jgi:hypothetical protein